MQRHEIRLMGTRSGRKQIEDQKTMAQVQLFSTPRLFVTFYSVVLFQQLLLYVVISNQA